MKRKMEETIKFAINLLRKKKQLRKAMKKFKAEHILENFQLKAQDMPENN